MNTIVDAVATAAESRQTAFNLIMNEHSSSKANRIRLYGNLESKLRAVSRHVASNSKGLRFYMRNAVGIQRRNTNRTEDFVKTCVIKGMAFNLFHVVPRDEDGDPTGHAYNLARIGNFEGDSVWVVAAFAAFLGHFHYGGRGFYAIQDSDVRAHFREFWSLFNNWMGIESHFHVPAPVWAL